jgi:hypothetical protein
VFLWGCMGEGGCDVDFDEPDDRELIEQCLGLLSVRVRPGAELSCNWLDVQACMRW